MATFASMKLKINQDFKTIKYLDKEIKVIQYLPIKDKIDLIEIVLENSKLEEGYYHPVKLDQYFHLYLVYMYTDIQFTDKQREDENKLYDILKSNNIIDNVLQAIPDTEYQELLDFMQERIDNEMNYSTTFAGIATKIIGDLPKSAAAAQSIVDNFDKDKFQAVKDFAIAANGGREI